MMVHDLIPIQGNQTLPGGGKVDFGNGGGANKVPNHHSTKKNPSRHASGHRRDSPSLPNGTKPIFDDNQDDKSKDKSKDKLKDKLKDKDKADKKPKDKKKDKKKVEVYAGSSFHSSPEALKLPKPSFKPSPKVSNDTMVQPAISPYPQPYNGSVPQGPGAMPMMVPNGQHPQQMPYYYYPQPPMMMSPPQQLAMMHPPSTTDNSMPSTTQPQLGAPMVPMPMQMPPMATPMYPGQAPGYYYPYYMNAPPNGGANGVPTGTANTNGTLPPSGPNPNQSPINHAPSPSQPTPASSGSPSNHPGQKISFNDLLGSSK